MDNELMGTVPSSLVPLRRSFQLPTSSAGADSYAEENIVQSCETSPDHHIAGRRITCASEIAAEHGDLQKIGCERSAEDAWF
ncbi:hypothetical protein [Acidocella aminolytica]|uniref:Uncharacterized protein n=1 Tax=Acidocella aminolytica 101 = DSM 11237 TaxID=1120923 RepID=A0A0D6PKX4_9PROT|nr:hypothetical protein [Acidocella aminolytica]GAN81863.1 hypothetical protein Aam_125_005 [Acidocella aminolytica 101 = DSM 11237]GBQ39940.1 hypothetical protein AA11237_2222 [Acidocella aminolytica 101 = DSM 11237]SHF14144.1 hypothetical protein SAMN02746095_02233 [Acidocella aminolytica 101 = DSM 11237]